MCTRHSLQDQKCWLYLREQEYLDLLSGLDAFSKTCRCCITCILLFLLIHRVPWGDPNQQHFVFLNLTAVIDPDTQEAGYLCCHKKPRKSMLIQMKKKNKLWEQLGKQPRSSGPGSCQPGPQVTALTNRVHWFHTYISAASLAFTVISVIFKAIIVLANQQYNLTTAV